MLDTCRQGRTDFRTAMHQIIIIFSVEPLHVLSTQATALGPRELKSLSLYRATCPLLLLHLHPSPVIYNLRSI
jgi:hypothetical protein